jgi:hypothetical protein
MAACLCQKVSLRGILGTDQHLERDAPVQLLIDGPVDLTERAVAEPCDRAVPERAVLRGVTEAMGEFFADKFLPQSVPQGWGDAGSVLLDLRRATFAQLQRELLGQSPNFVALPQFVT